MSSVIVRKKSTQLYRLFAICPGGLDEILKSEIEKLGAPVLQAYPGGVEFEGNLELAYRACLSLRTASRVLLLLHEDKKVFDETDLTRAANTVEWFKIFNPQCTFAVYVTDTQKKSRREPINVQYWALKAKDAIVDQFRERFGERPDVDRADPDITIRFHLHDRMLKVYLDLSGKSLHERGYRTQSGEAPLKENLAAGLLLLAGWDEAAQEKVLFYDPFCGSGTLLIEAALIATHTAPGLFRHRFGFISWKDHQPSLFLKTVEQLQQKRILDPLLISEIKGSDRNPEMLDIALNNIERAGVKDFISLAACRFEDTIATQPKGLMVTNPPYGVRLEEISSLITTYQAMGSTLKHHYKGWTAGIITSEKQLLNAIGLKPSKKYSLHNGGLESIFNLFTLY